MSPPDDLDRLSHAELKSLVIKQWEQVVELQRLVAQGNESRLTAEWAKDLEQVAGVQ